MNLFLYRMLLHLCPKAWRTEYAEEMSAVFAARLRQVQGPLAVIALWLHTIPDLLTSAAAIHLDLLRQDLRYAARTLRRSPGFAFAAVSIAALGIGATTAAFTLVDHVLIRALPFTHADRLVKLYEDHRAQNASHTDLSPANFRDWKSMSTSFELLGAYRTLSLNLTGQGDPQTLGGASVSAEVFPILGAQPAVGRGFRPDDDREGAVPTVILSYGFWKSLYAGDPAILGRTIRLYDDPYTVIGIMPAGFYFPNREAQIWTTLRFGPRDYEDRLDTYIFGIGRIRTGVSLQQARAELRAVAGKLSAAYPNELANTGSTLVLLRDDVSTQAVFMLKVLLGAALCVLLIACTNLANLMLARALVRRRELAVRTALGAGRERLMRQMLTESLMLAIAGGALGLALAHFALPLLVRLVPVALPIAEVPAIDARVLLTAALLTAVTGIGFGVAPALRASRGRSALELHEGGRAGIGGGEALRSGLVIVEVAGCIVLLVGFGLLTRALWRVQSVDPGFRPDGALTLRTALPMPRYQAVETREPFYQQVLDAARRLPGVTGAAYTSFLPLTNFGGIWPVGAEGHAEPENQRRTVSLRFVTPGFFGVMGIPRLAGRDFTAADSNNAPYVALASESLVRRYWGNENAVGHFIEVGNHRRRIIGVVGNVRFRGLERQNEPQVYVSWLQPDSVSPWYAPKDLVVRTAVDPVSLAPALRRIIHQADPNQPISNVRPLDDLVEAQTSSRRVQLYVLGAFGLIASLLAAVGIHSLLAFAVSNRTREIGVRMALGARQVDILRMMLLNGMRLAVAGIALGGVMSWGVGRLLESLLAGVEPHDGATFAAAVGLAIVMTLAGSLIPAIRAVRVDPVTAIRAD